MGAEEVHDVGGTGPITPTDLDNGDIHLIYWGTKIGLFEPDPKLPRVAVLFKGEPGGGVEEIGPAWDHGVLCRGRDVMEVEKGFEFGCGEKGVLVDAGDEVGDEVSRQGLGVEGLEDLNRGCPTLDTTKVELTQTLFIRRLAKELGEVDHTGGIDDARRVEVALLAVEGFTNEIANNNPVW